MSHGESMVSSLKNNRRPKRSRFEHKEVDSIPSENWKKVLKQKATSKQLAEIKLKLALENDQEQHKKIMAFALTIILLGMLFTLLYFLWEIQNNG